MRFQGSGFTVELDDASMDVSAYAFSYLKLGEMPPMVTLRFERGNDAKMTDRLQDLYDVRFPSLPEPHVRAEPQLLKRGDWEYFTFVVEFGQGDTRVVQKEIQILITTPAPTVYVITGTDLADNFPRFEPAYDAFVRSFQPNEAQRLNR